MTKRFLRHEAPESADADPRDLRQSHEGNDGDSLPADLDIVRDSEDINAIAETHQRRFPLAALLIACAAIIALIAGVVYFVKREMGAISVKQTTPVASPDPLLTAKPLDISEIPPHFSQSDQANPSAAVNTDPSAGQGTTATASSQGSPGCPHVQVKDPLGNPVLDANGLPAMMDCQGRVVRAPEIVPSVQPAPAATSSTNASQRSSTTGSQAAPTISTDRYRGAIVPGKDESSNSPFGADLLKSPPSSAEAAISALQQQLTLAGPFSPIANATPPVAVAPVPLPETSGRSGTQGRNVAVKSIDENLVIPKGHTADCTLTMRAVTETNGFAECIITANVYSANGRTLLIERFSKALGEYNVNSAAGQRVIPILWTSIRKPGGITIELSAPAVDGLGGAGLPATVDSRWGERIGGAYLLSIVKDVMAYKTAKDASGAAGGQVYQNTTQTSNDIVDKILSTTIGIRPTLYANQGDRALILFNRDVDFSGVYDVQRRK